MNSVFIAIGAAVLYLLAYHTYGKFLARKIFKINPDNPVPSKDLQDDVDFVPTKKEILFGHHFTSIAGTGPIVGPAIAIIWGWLPALIWVILGSIFMGAVHDFGSLVASLRHQGRSIGDFAGDIVNSRVKFLFLIIIFFALLIVVAVFGVVIGACYDMYPQAILPSWLQIPIAVTLGYFIYKKGFSPFWPSIIAVVAMYLTIVLGSYYPIKVTVQTVNDMGQVVSTFDPVSVWVVLLLIYAYVASTLPVHTLLQPRDYINSHQLFIAMGLLGLGVLFAHPDMVAPPVVENPPVGSLPLFPMLFVFVACGAISGFHSLVSSGTSSKQCSSEKDALSIGYGSMLLEGMLAVFVIIACAGGIGLGYQEDGQTFTGYAAFAAHYDSWKDANSLGAKLGAFVIGATRMIEVIGIPAAIATTIMGVFIVSFAATTLDTATRIQRYIVGELASACKLNFLTGKHPATMIAVGSALLLAFYNGSGKGAMTLWPLFGCTNQLLAALSLLVVTVYLAHKKYPVIYTMIPMLLMVVLTGWAMYYTIAKFYHDKNWLLLFIGLIIVVLEIWMIIESSLLMKELLKSKTPTVSKA